MGKMSDILDVAKIEAAGKISDRILARKYCRDSDRLTMAWGIEASARAMARMVVEMDVLAAEVGGVPRMFGMGKVVPGGAACRARTP